MLQKKRDIEEILRELGEGQCKLQESQREFQKGMQELRESQLKTEESHRKTEESHRKTEESLRELEKSLNKASGDFTRKWGHFLENLIEGDLVSLLRNWGLKEISAEIVPISNIKVPSLDGSEYELDLIASNGDYAIVVEVKTTLTISKIDKFHKNLGMLKDDLPAYKEKKVYACVAYMKTAKETGEEDRVLAYLEECGIFAIKAPGGESNIARISNSKNFKPKTF